MDIPPLALWIIIVVLSIQGCDSQCNFPSSIWGTWIRERDGKSFTISSSSFQGFNYYSGTQFYNDFRCQEINGATYVIVQDLPRAYTVDNQFVYLCLTIEVFGANSFLMTDLANVSSKISVSDVDLTLVNGFVDINPTLTSLDVCAFQPSEIRSNIMYRSGKGDTAGEMTVACPSIIHGNYNYTFDGTKCTGNSSFAVCPGRTNIAIDYVQCADQVAYSTSGNLECMGAVTRGANTYLWTWIGTGTFSSTTIRTVCFALEDNGGTVSASYTPQDCFANQVASSVSPGGLLSMVPLELCPITSDAEDDGIGAIAGGAAVGILILIAIAVVVIVFLMKKRNKKLNTVQDDGKKSTHPSKTSTANGKTPTNGHVKNVTIVAPAVVTTVNESSTAAKKGQKSSDKSPEKPKESPSKVQDNPKPESKPSEPTSRPPPDAIPAAAAATSTTTVAATAKPASTTPVTASSTPIAASSSTPSASATTTTAAAAPPTAPPTAATTPAPTTPASTPATTATPTPASTVATPTPAPTAATTPAPPTPAPTAATTAAPKAEPTAVTTAAVTTNAGASSGSLVKAEQAGAMKQGTTESSVKPSPEDTSKAPQEENVEKSKKKKKKKKKDKKKSE
ncbi:anti-sigma-I factor RsgI2-like [Haliotis cracherodii]|uniref:anti-sigma-I factor RsgI2-like n=1 Tax=Haliotis cracherodii TaxID=6455 RepID=UPI0039EA61CD